MMPDSDSQEPLKFFHEQVTRVGKIFSLAAIALFGVMCFPGFFQRFPHLGPDEWLVGIAGVALLGFDFQLWRYFTRPRLTLSDEGMNENRLFGMRAFRYADMAGLTSYLERFYPTGPNGRSSIPRFLHRLIVRTRDGREHTVTLPAFDYMGISSTPSPRGAGCGSSACRIGKRNAISSTAREKLLSFRVRGGSSSLAKGSFLEFRLLPSLLDPLKRELTVPVLPECGETRYEAMIQFYFEGPAPSDGRSE